MKKHSGIPTAGKKLSASASIPDTWGRHRAGLGDGQVKIASAGRHRPAPGVRAHSVTEWPTPGLLATAPSSCHWAQCRQQVRGTGRGHTRSTARTMWAAAPSMPQDRHWESCRMRSQDRKGGPREQETQWDATSIHTNRCSPFIKLSCRPCSPCGLQQPHTPEQKPGPICAASTDPPSLQHPRRLLASQRPRPVHPPAPTTGSGWGRYTETQRNQMHQVLPKLQNHETTPSRGHPWPGEGRSTVSPNSPFTQRQVSRLSTPTALLRLKSRQLLLLLPRCLREAAPSARRAALAGLWECSLLTNIFCTQQDMRPNRQR